MKAHTSGTALANTTFSQALRCAVLLLSMIFLSLVSASCASQGAALDSLPLPVPGKFNMAVVAAGSGSAGDFSEAHRLGVDYVNALSLAGGSVQAVFIGSVPELSDQQQLFSRLGELGYRLVVGAEAGYTDSMQAAAARNPGTVYLAIRGLKNNGGNFSGVDVPLETAYFIAGLAAGARIEADIIPPPAAAPTPAGSGAPLPPTQPAAPPAVQRLVGMIASYVTPEQFRYINAAALGMHITCPDCRMDVRFLNGWNAKDREKELANELLNAGVHVLFATTGGEGALEAVESTGNRWVVLESLPGKCQANSQCLAAVSWDWGKVYQDLAQKVAPGNFRSEPFYTVGAGGIVVSGLMPSEALSPKLSSIPQDRIDFMRAYLTAFIQGTRKANSIFSIDTIPGGFKDNLGREIIRPDGRSTLTESDLHQFPPGALNHECDTCIYWYAEWIRSELPPAGN